MMTEEQLATACKALSHPARIRILKQLLEEGRCVCGHIVELMPLAQSTVSQHLKILKEAGLVQGEIEGQATCYCVDQTAVLQMVAGLTALVDIRS
jgi:DNA-binding transcriptional ArsR family regulator